MTKLSDIQIQLLSEAVATDTGSILPPPEHKAAATGLIKRGFAISLPQPDGPSRLVITEAGRAALSPEEQAPGPKSSSEEESHELAELAPPPAPPELDPKPPTKLAILQALLRRPEGTDVKEMMAATGWQPHSVRGALAGALKKGLGLGVISEKTEDGRRYRIDGADASEAAA